MITVKSTVVSTDRRHSLIVDDYSFQVRFAALITVLALAEKLKENYIVLLPESIPFLAELMEGKSGANTDTKSCGHRLSDRFFSPRAQVRKLSPHSP